MSTARSEMVAMVNPNNINNANLLIDMLKQLLQSLPRADVERWLDEALLAFAKSIPNPIFRLVVVSMGPKLIDMILDQLFGPDAD